MTSTQPPDLTIDEQDSDDPGRWLLGGHPLQTLTAGHAITTDGSRFTRTGGGNGTPTTWRQS